MLDERKNVLNNQWILILVRGDKLSRVKIIKNENDNKKTSSKITQTGPTDSVEH